MAPVFIPWGTSLAATVNFSCFFIYLQSRLRLAYSSNNFQLEACLSPGLTILNWNSLNVDHYIERVHKELAATALFIKKARTLICISNIHLSPDDILMY